MTASYSSFQTVMMQQKQAATTQRRTPSPGEPMGSSSSGGMQGFAGDDYSPTPGADASSQSSPGSASDHMGMFSTTSTAASSSHNPPNFPGSAALAAFDAEKHPHMNRIITTTTSSNNGASQENLSAMTRKKPDATSGVVGNPTVTTVRRQKRLQRNRESARLSRRRRKQYLEELEERVDKLSEDLDLARRRHAMEAIVVMKQKRIALLNTTTPHNVNLNALETVLARTSQELMIATTFQGQQLKSFSAAPSMQFILWLSLQTDAFFRGGRAASERLSAARIGERVRILLLSM
jgi:bZIP transcription factor